MGTTLSWTAGETVRGREDDSGGEYEGQRYVQGSKLSAGVPLNGASNRIQVDDADTTIIKRVMELAEKKGWKMSQVALVWIIQKNTIPIVGFSNLGRLDEAVEVKGKSLTDEEMKYLEEPYVSKGIVGHQ